MKPIRNSAKAIIMENGKLLCTKNKDSWGIFYLLPGGGQETGETLHEALKRECREEIGVDIIPGKLRFIREYIGKNHEFAAWDQEVHQIEFMFRAEVVPGSNIKNGAIPDQYQVGVEWLQLQQLQEVRIYPAILKKVLLPEMPDDSPIYLGDAN